MNITFSTLSINSVDLQRVYESSHVPATGLAGFHDRWSLRSPNGFGFNTRRSWTICRWITPGHSEVLRIVMSQPNTC